MKVKIFQSRKLVRLEEAVNAFLAEMSETISIQHTQFSTVYAQDEVAHVMFHTLLLFYYPRVEEPDPFQEQDAQAAVAELDRETGTHAPDCRCAWCEPGSDPL